MTDDFSGGSSPSEAPVSSPSESSSMGHPVDVASDPTINATRHVALEQLAKSENIEEYAQERQDQSEAMDEGKDLPRRASAAMVPTCIKGYPGCSQRGRWRHEWAARKA